MDGSRKIAGCITLVFLAFLSAEDSFALIDNVNNEWHSTARALAQGNATIAAPDDATTAMFYNPAGLASSRKIEFEPMHPQFEFSTGNFKAANKITQQGKLVSLDKAAPLLKDHKGVPSQYGASIYPNFSARNFSLGILARGEGGAYVNGDGSLRIRSQYVLIPTLGISVGLISGLIKFGVAARGVQATVNDTTTTDLNGVGYRKDTQEGFGIGVDSGLIITFPIDTLPALALVGRNLGDTRLNGKPLYRVGEGYTNGGQQVKMSFDGGFSMQPKLGKTTVLKFSSDYRDITNKSHTPSWRKLNAGFEFGLNRRVFFRFGGSQGYWSAGFGLQGKGASLDLTTYGEELDPTKFRVVEDRRVALSYGGKF